MRHGGKSSNQPDHDSVPVRLAVELLRRGRPVTIVAGGGSMWPLVREGDRLVIEPLRTRTRNGTPTPSSTPPPPPSSLPRVGDLAAVLRGDHLVAHRVIRVGSAGILLRGDNTGGADPVVTPDEVLGVVTRQVLRTGHVVDHRRRWIHALNLAAAHTIRLGRRPRRLALSLARVWSALS